jgi:hypothetical protein
MQLSDIELEELIELIQNEVLKIEIGLLQKPELANINEHTKTEIIECCKWEQGMIGYYT